MQMAQFLKSCFMCCFGARKKNVAKHAGLLPQGVRNIQLANTHSSLDINKEFEKAFRTPSGADLLNRVEKANAHYEQGESSAQGASRAAAAASPYHHLTVLALYIVDPSQLEVRGVLDNIEIELELKSKTLSFFELSAETSRLCGQVLTAIEKAKTLYGAVNNAFDDGEGLTEEERHSLLVTEMAAFIDAENPFANIDLGGLHGEMKSLMSAFEGETRNLVSTVRRMRFGRRVCTGIAVGASVAVGVLALVLSLHGVALAVPLSAAKWAVGDLMGCFSGILSTKKTKRVLEVTDAATRASYILTRDMDTIGCLLDMLYDDMEYTKGMVGFWLQRMKDRGPGVGLAVHLRAEMRRNFPVLENHLDELRQHVFLCFLTVNRARSLVFNEIRLLNY